MQTARCAKGIDEGSGQQLGCLALLHATGSQEMVLLVVRLGVVLSYMINMLLKCPSHMPWASNAPPLTQSLYKLAGLYI